MPFALLSRLRVYYVESGSGLPVVFLHGFTLDHRSWAPIVPYLSQKCRTIVADSRGHGKSDCPLTDYARSDRVRDLLELLDQLAIDRCHLVGLSMGGSTAIGMALTHPSRLLSLTLVSSGAAGYPLGKKIDRLDKMAKDESVEAAKATWKDWSSRYYRQKGNEQLAAALEEMIDDHSGAIWLDHRRGKYPRSNDLDLVETIQTPTLIMTGQDDKLFVPLGRALHEKIAGSRLIEYPDAGHMIPMELPERFSNDLGQFLESV